MIDWLIDWLQALQVELEQQQDEVNSLQHMVVVIDEASSDNGKYKTTIIQTIDVSNKNEKYLLAKADDMAHINR